VFCKARLLIVVALLAAWPAQAGAAVAYTTIQSAEGTASGVNMTTSSATPVSGDLYLLTIYANAAGGTSLTVTGTNGFSGTWTQVGAQTLTGDGSQVLSVAWSYATSNTAGTINAAGTNGGWFFGYSLTRVTGAHASAAVIQTVAATNTGTSATVTLAAFGSATNSAFFSAFCEADKVATYSAGSATLIDSQTVFFSVRSMFVQGEATQDTSPTGTWTGSTNWIGIGIEIAEAAGGGGGTVNLPAGALTAIGVGPS
jgi:hypothetical protein